MGEGAGPACPGGRNYPPAGVRLHAGNCSPLRALSSKQRDWKKEDAMGFGRGALLWLLGVPLPIIILLALFWHS